MNMLQDILITLGPALLLVVLISPLRGRKVLLASMCGIPLSFALLKSQTWFINLMEQSNKTYFISGFLLFAILLVIRTLSQSKVTSRLVGISAALSLVIVCAWFTPLKNEGFLLSGAMGLLLGTIAIAVGLIADIEEQREEKLDFQHSTGLAYLYPRHSGLILACLMLLGSIPGSLLFLIEDVLLHEIGLYGWVGGAAVLLITSIASISAYQVFTQVFCGRTFEELPERLRRDPSPLVGVVLLVLIVAGITPRLFL